MEPYEVFLRRIFMPEISECFIQEEIELVIRNLRSTQDKQIYLDFIGFGILGSIVGN
jgi:hypothetical protein